MAAAALAVSLAGCGGVAARPATDGTDCETGSGIVPASYQDPAGWEPTETHAIGETFTVADWTVTVREIDHDATDEVLEALAERGLTYEGTPVADWTWVVAEVELTYHGPGEVFPQAELATFYLDGDGGLRPDHQCGMSNVDSKVASDQTVTILFGVPVPPNLVPGGHWAISLDTGKTVHDTDDLSFVQ